MQQKPHAPPVLEPADAVLKFLASVGPSADAEFYLRLFRGRARERFATIAVEAAAIEHDADGVVVDLRFLRDLELTPVVVLGLDRAESAEYQRSALAELLRDAGVETEALALEATDAIAAAARRGVIPLLAATDADRALRLERLARVLAALQTHKLIFLSPEGGLSARGERLSVINLGTEYETLSNGSLLDTRERRLLEDSHRLIFELVPQALLVSVTSPLNLLHELFTVKGAGTLLRKGARIARFDGYAGVDRERLRELLASSFGKTPNPELFKRPLLHAYVEEDYRGAALIQGTTLGGYLSKFAVTREAQGEGVGQDLWNVLCADHRSLIWRARRENPIRAWYERKCQGRFEAGGWTVYFRGLHTHQIAEAIELALSQPVDF
jgi:acetylglutamate kinase